MLSSHPAEGETPSFKGSMMLAVAESESEVRQLLANDIYGTSGVWDLENAQIIPVCLFFSVDNRAGRRFTSYLGVESSD
jgi:hypothetical protein